MTDDVAAEAAPVAEAAPLTVTEAAEAVASVPTEPADPAKEPEPEPEVAEATPSEPRRGRVTAKGAGKIFKGELIGGIEQMFAEGDEFDAAEAHFAAGFAEPV